MCEHGDTVPMVVCMPAWLSYTGKARLKRVPVDRCLALLVYLLNAEGLFTANCCCGHGKGPGSIVLADRTQLTPGAAWALLAGIWRKRGGRC